MIRILDIIISFILILLLTPIGLIIIAWIKFDSHGPVIFKQKRVGKNGIEFYILKFRSMYIDSDKNQKTSAGNFIRKYKLDELPQLFNVLIGQMSIVGPRPELKKHVDLYSEYQRTILNVLPGITDFASIKYSNEASLLNSKHDPEAYYVDHIMPEKLILNRIYIDEYTVFNYFKIIYLTFKKIVINKND